MKIPVVLPAVHVRVQSSGAIEVDLDGAPHQAERALSRDDLTTVLDQITTELQSPVRVEIVEEADGTTYADIALPPTEAPGPVQPPMTPTTAPAPLSGVAGRGFRSGESVVIAYVLARQTADDDGAACLRVPSAVLASRRVNLVLVGLSSGTVTTLEEPA